MLKNGNVQLVLGMLLGLIVAGMIGYIIYTAFFAPKKTPVSQSTNTSLPSNLETAKSNDVIAKVGQENIYKNDLDLELTSYPPQKGINRQEVLMQKLIEDSIILQAGEQQGYVKLDASIFNTKNKDYLKRMRVVDNVRKQIEERSNAFEGKVIAIWFGNTIPAPIGPAAGKALALSKITALHQAVKSKQITIDQAAQQIRNDTSLAQVDPTSYKTNALLTFAVTRDEAITFDPTFDGIIRKLTVGEISDVYLAKAKDSEKNVPVDALYMFAQLTKKDSNAIPSFDAWYADKKNNYEITYY